MNITWSLFHKLSGIQIKRRMVLNKVPKHKDVRIVADKGSLAGLEPLSYSTVTPTKYQPK